MSQRVYDIMQKINYILLAVLLLVSCFIPNQSRLEAQSCKSPETIYSELNKAAVIIVGAAGSYGSVEANSTGSGIVVDEKGTIITSTHVVNRSDLIGAITYDRTIYEYRVKTLGRQSSVTVLEPVQQFPSNFVSLKAKSNVAIGQPIYLLSNPTGFLGLFTNGIVSNVGSETITISTVAGPGSSGGAVVNCYGEVIGFMFAQSKDIKNLFSINPVQDALDELAKSK